MKKDAKIFLLHIIESIKLIENYMKEAAKIMDSIDPDDTPFIAVALATGSDIWSDDSHFQKQKRIRIRTTIELSQMLDS